MRLPWGRGGLGRGRILVRIQVFSCALTHFKFISQNTRGLAEKLLVGQIGAGVMVQIQVDSLFKPQPA